MEALRVTFAYSGWEEGGHALKELRFEAAMYLFNNIVKDGDTGTYRLPQLSFAETWNRVHLKRFWE